MIIDVSLPWDVMTPRAGNEEASPAKTAYSGSGTASAWRK
jgi:hypothetical protein